MNDLEVKLLCGEKTVDLELGGPFFLMEMEEMPPLSDPVAEVGKALSRPIGTPPLRELAKGRKNACVVISDFTRPVLNRIILPPLLS